MEEKLLNKVYELKDSLENDPRVIKLKAAEKEMENDDEVMKLSYAFSCVQSEYNDALRHFSKESLEAKKIQHKLYEAKLALDLHPLVKKYNEAYKEVRKMYALIQEEIINPFISKCEEKR